MRPAKFSVGPVLWLAGWCLLAAGDPSGQEEPWQPCSPQLGSENCPHPTKSATLVPSFTKTPRPTTTTPPSKHTTTHHHHRHTTPTAPTTHTTHHHVTTTPKKHTTTHHATTAPANHTSAHHPTTHHPTTAHQKHTTSRHTTTAPANHTSAHHPTTHHPTTAHQHTTSRHAATTAPANHTSAPHSTTTAPPPTQPPAVLVGNYTVKQGANICLRAEMGLQMQIRYADKAKQQVWGAFAVQPNHTNFSGACSDKTATLKLHFPEGFILFTFEKNQTEKEAYLSQVQANLTYQFPQATEKTFRANNASLREFAAPLGKSYQCRNRSLALSENFRLTALSERIQAFQLQDGKFGEAEVCPEQKRSIVLPVVVGVVLLILILIVLVAFAVGRWRTRTGYESL